MMMLSIGKVLVVSVGCKIDSLSVERLVSEERYYFGPLNLRTTAAAFAEKTLRRTVYVHILTFWHSEILRFDFPMERLSYLASR
jgi:hypothetical protein